MVRRPRNIGIVLGNKSMFELETAIDDWKLSFGKNDVVSPKETSELEEHLRGLIIDLGNSGLSQREAFMVGADRLGHPSELEQEYAKVNSGAQWRKRVFWMLTGYIAMTVVGTIVSAVVAIAGTGMAIAGVEGTVSAVALIAVMVLGWSGLPVLAYRQFQNLGGRGEHLPVKWFVATGIMLVVAPIITFGGRIAQTRIVDPSWYGESAVYFGFGGFAIHLGVVVFCFIAMWKFNNPIIEAID